MSPRSRTAHAQTRLWQTYAQILKDIQGNQIRSRKFGARKSGVSPCNLTSQGTTNGEVRGEGRSVGKRANEEVSEKPVPIRRGRRAVWGPDILSFWFQATRWVTTFLKYDPNSSKTVIMCPNNLDRPWNFIIKEFNLVLIDSYSKTTGKHHNFFKTQASWAQSPALPFTTCAGLGKLFHLSTPHIPHV